MINNKLKVKVRFLNTSEGDIEDHNLINDDGLDMLATNYIADVFKNLQWGDGVRQNARESAGVLLTQTGTTIISPVPFFTVEDGTFGRLLIFLDGTQANIVTRISDVQVTVVENQAVAAQTATVFHTEETDLENSLASYNSYVAAASGSTVDFTSDILTIEDKRVFDLGTAGSDIVRTEFGWGPTAGVGDAVFGRIVKDITWLTGAAIQIEVTVTRTMDCSIVTIASLPVTGAANPATSRLMFGSTTLQAIAYRSSVDAAGASVIGASAGVSLLEPYFTGTQLNQSVSETASTLDFTNIADSTAGDNQLWVLDSYSAGNYSRSFTAQFIGETFVSAVWRNVSMWIASQVSQFRILFNSNESFDGQLSDLVIKCSWGRN